MTLTANPGVSIIGYGAITDEIVSGFEASGGTENILCVLVRPERLETAKAKARRRFEVVDSISDMLRRKPSVVIEAAGHQAVRELGCQVLQHNCDLLVASAGALADRELSERLAHATQGGSNLWLASGAVAGIDGILAARTAGLHSLTYTSIKQPAAWSGTPAEELLAGTPIRLRTIFFSGSAREAALLYPRNANVGVTIALAGLGLDRTQVHLGADPGVEGPLGIIEAAGHFGRFHFEILGLASQTNPKTSAITGHSLVSAVRQGMRFCLWPTTNAGRKTLV